MKSAEILRRLNTHLDAVEDLSIEAKLTRHRLASAIRLAQLHGQSFAGEVKPPRSRSHGLAVLVAEMMRPRIRPRRSRHARAWNLAIHDFARGSDGRRLPGQ
jgi:hypothetical protein